VDLAEAALAELLRERVLTYRPSACSRRARASSLTSKRVSTMQSFVVVLSDN